MKRAILIGADGFIGTHLCRRLCEDSVEVWANILPQSPSRKRIETLPGIRIVESGIDELCLHADRFASAPDAVYYLAWQGVNAAQRDDYSLQYKNIDMGVAALRFAAKIKATRFIFPGSTSEYLYYQHTINADAVPSAHNAYGCIKIALRFILQALAKELGIPFVYAVITSTYAEDRRDNNVIFYVIDSLLNGKIPNLTPLEQRWDYIHIDDVAEALYILGEKGQDGGFYPVGCGDNRPLAEYIEHIRNYIDPSMPLGIGKVPYPEGKRPSSCIDITPMRDLGFTPQIGFAEGIVRVIDKIREEVNG